MADMAKRLSDTYGMVGSPTAHLQKFDDVLKSGGVDGAVAHQISKMVRKVIPTMDDAAIYKITNDVDGLHAFMQLMEGGAIQRVKDKAGAAGALLGRISAAIARHDYAQALNPEQQERLKAQALRGMGGRGF